MHMVQCPMLVLLLLLVVLAVSIIFSFNKHIKQLVAMYHAWMIDRSITVRALHTRACLRARAKDALLLKAS